MKMLAMLLFAFSALAQTAPPPADPFQSLAFLRGPWQAKTGGGTAAANVIGNYTFAPELGGHILSRRSKQAACSGPKAFDCDHSDLLYVYPEGPGLKAIYFDKEGHTLHYDVTVPAAGKAVFLSEPGPGPRFQLIYELKDGILSGRFQMQMPGSTEWKSYLEWSGPKG